MSRNNSWSAAIIRYRTSPKQLPWSFEITRWCWKPSFNLSDWQVHTQKTFYLFFLYLFLPYNGEYHKCSNTVFRSVEPQRIHSLRGFSCEPHYVRVDCSRVGDSKKWTQSDFWSPRLVLCSCHTDKSFLGKKDICCTHGRCVHLNIFTTQYNLVKKLSMRYLETHI